MFAPSFSISFCLAVSLLILCISLFETQCQLTHPTVKGSTLPVRKNQGLLLCNVLILSSLGSLWHLPILLIKYKCGFILSVVYSYSERLPLSEIFFFYVWSISMAKDHRFAEECSPRLWWN